MSRPITKQDARKIAKKLKAKIVKNRTAHDQAEFYHKGMLILSFGIRRGSSKDSGHGHIPGDMFITHHQTLEFSDCNLTLASYIKILKEKRRIVEEEAAT